MGRRHYHSAALTLPVMRSRIASNVNSGGAADGAVEDAEAVEVVKSDLMGGEGCAAAGGLPENA